MKCPFLKETRVKFCQVAPIKKFIVSDQGDTEVEKCSTSSWTNCPVAQQRIKEKGQYKQCPFLQESFVQYCSLSAITKFIPYNEAPFSRCTNANHHYCEHYLAMEKPDSTGSSTPISDTKNVNDNTARDYRIDGIRMPRKLQYSFNHMWMDISEEGMCHIGVNAFLSKVLGSIEAISFVTTKGVEKPTAIFRVNGVDLEIVFPKQLLITGLNSYLRAMPEKLTADPYGAGWLFEGQVPKNTDDSISLLKGQKALQWMKLEADRLTKFVHAELSQPKLEGKILMADGGVCIDSLASYLTRDDLHKLFHTFFSLHV